MKTEDYKKLVRLYVPEPDYVARERYALSEGQAHYLRNVMRKETGSAVRVFNGRDGDWIATLIEIKKNSAIIEFDKQISEQRAGADIWVITSVIKKEPFDLMVEKSCELGAARFLPVVCDHTVVHKINRERLQAVAIEAAEQSERGDVMEVEALNKLKNTLKIVSSERNIIFCLEREVSETFAQIAKKLSQKPIAVLIGPEGGFSEDEVAYIKSLPNVYPVSLGEGVLRAETALIAALAGVQLCA